MARSAWMTKPLSSTASPFWMEVMSSRPMSRAINCCIERTKLGITKFANVATTRVSAMPMVSAGVRIDRWLIPPDEAARCSLSAAKRW